ncbi:TfoX/Sxy family protein [Flagellimonas meishanensis]|uniref:TfoX/Sxy family protein n=1 Tax=Flagellimonas meishanensis TaxID=2873264 RepID=UPI001CA6D6AD|nr:TfoX/Sxy family protein [[Muricauda] meishanensis]
MGSKGDRATSEGQLAADLLVSKLGRIEGVTIKKMFGGHGVFHQGKMFGIVDSKGIVHFKTDDSSYGKYEALLSKKHGKMPYHSVPDKILDDPETLLVWAKEAIELSKK